MISSALLFFFLIYLTRGVMDVVASFGMVTKPQERLYLNIASYVPYLLYTYLPLCHFPSIAYNYMLNIGKESINFGVSKPGVI